MADVANALARIGAYSNAHRNLVLIIPRPHLGRLPDLLPTRTGVVHKCAYRELRVFRWENTPFSLGELPNPAAVDTVASRGDWATTEPSFVPAPNGGSPIPCEVLLFTLP